MFTSTQGWIGVALAIACWGTFTSFTKTKRVQAVHADPMLIQIYCGIVVCASSMLPLVAVEFVFSFWGVAAAFIWVPVVVGLFYGVQALGIGVAQGICSGLTIITSFLWGSIGSTLWGDPKCQLVNTGGAVLGLAILIVSVGGLSYFGTPEPPGAIQPDGDHKTRRSLIAHTPNLKLPVSTETDRIAATGYSDAGGYQSAGRSFHPDALQARRVEQGIIIRVSGDSGLFGSETGIPDYKRRLLPARSHDRVIVDDNGLAQASSSSIDLDSPSPGVVDVVDSGSGSSSGAKPGRQRLGKLLLQVLGCALVGAGGGSVMVPAMFANHAGVSGLRYMPSFGIGVGMATLLLAVVWSAARRRCPEWHFRVVGPSGCMVGLLWNIGNAGSLVASLSPLGQTIGYPSTQASILLAGFMAIVVYKEIRSRSKVIGFTASALVLLVGAGLLAVFGACS